MATIKCDCGKEIILWERLDVVLPFPCPDCGSLLDPATWPDVKAYLAWVDKRKKVECADTFSLHVRTPCSDTRDDFNRYDAD